VSQEEDSIEIIAPVENFKTLMDALRAAKFTPEEAELRMIATNEMELSVEQTMQVMRTIDSLEELDDVQNVYHTLKFSDEAMAALESAED
jgi:transcriptional/translational regulatory protein YebC/TACO1